MIKRPQWKKTEVGHYELVLPVKTFYMVAGARIHDQPGKQDWAVVDQEFNVYCHVAGEENLPPFRPAQEKLKQAIRAGIDLSLDSMEVLEGADLVQEA